MVRHSKEDAVGDRLFEELLEAADRLKYPFDVECRFVLIGCGRLGFRAVRWNPHTAQALQATGA